MSERERYELPTHTWMVYARQALEAAAPPTIPHIVISITEPGVEPVAVPINRFTAGVLREAFWDVPYLVHRDGEPLHPMTVQQAQRIVRFARQHDEDVGVVICQCKAGISRSAATALALQILLDHRIHTAFPYTRPNLHVLRTLLQVGAEQHD